MRLSIPLTAITREKKLKVLAPTGGCEMGIRGQESGVSGRSQGSKTDYDRIGAYPA